MSERLSVICTCGYETLVPPEKLGQTVECFMCGAELEVDEAAVTDHHNVPDPEEGESESPAPESPIEAGGHPGVPDPETTHEEAETRERSPKKYRSPFEDDSDEPQAESESRGPFSLEPSSESEAGTSYSSLMEGIHTDFKSNRNVVIPTVSPHDMPTGETCAECGRQIRGSWDRVETPEGVICYICSNQATHGLPQRMTEDREARELDERDLLIDRAGPPEPPEPEVPWWRDPESDRFKKVLAGLAFGTLFFAVIVYLTGWGTPDETATTVTATEAAPEIQVPGWVTFIVWAWRVFAGIAGVWAALYLTLDRNDRLPHDRFLQNAIYIGIIVGILTLLSAALFVTSAIVGSIFVAGTIWMMLFGGLAVLAQFAILISLLDFRFSDFLWLYLFYLPVSQFLLQGIGMFLGWGLYEIAT